VKPIRGKTSNKQRHKGKAARWTRVGLGELILKIDITQSGGNTQWGSVIWPYINDITRVMASAAIPEEEARTTSANPARSIIRLHPIWGSEQ